MNKTHTFLEERFVIAVYLESKTEDYGLSSLITAEGFMQKLLDYWEISDYVNGNAEKNIFTQLYLSETNVAAVTVKQMCSKLYLQERTLYRYHLKFARFIGFMLKKYRINVIPDKLCLNKA